MVLSIKAFSGFERHCGNRAIVSLMTSCGIAGTEGANLGGSGLAPHHDLEFFHDRPPLKACFSDTSPAVLPLSKPRRWMRILLLHCSVVLLSEFLNKSLVDAT